MQGKENVTASQWDGNVVGNMAKPNQHRRGAKILHDVVRGSSGSSFNHFIIFFFRHFWGVWRQRELIAQPRVVPAQTLPAVGFHPHQPIVLVINPGLFGCALC